jgi:Sec-independent protein translocase protein TatA
MRCAPNKDGVRLANAWLWPKKPRRAKKIASTHRNSYKRKITVGINTPKRNPNKRTFSLVSRPLLRSNLTLHPPSQSPSPTMTKPSRLLLAPLLLLITIIKSSSAFVQPLSLSQKLSSTNSCQSLPSQSFKPYTSTFRPSFTSITTPIRSNKSTQLYSLFGLGPGELVIIAIAAIFLIGPSKLTEFTRSAGEVAGKEASAWKELKNIPEEFQKGLEEGEIESRSRKAKVMDKVADDEE